MPVVALGAGFGGLELTTHLSEALGADVEVVLVDQADRLRPNGASFHPNMLISELDPAAHVARSPTAPRWPTTSSSACPSTGCRPSSRPRA